MQYSQNPDGPDLVDPLFVPDFLDRVVYVPDGAVWPFVRDLPDPPPEKRYGIGFAIVVAGVVWMLIFGVAALITVCAR